MIPSFVKSKQGICNIDLPKGFPIHPQVSQSVQEFQEMCQVAKQRVFRNRLELVEFQFV